MSEILAVIGALIIGIIISIPTIKYELKKGYK